MPNSRRHLTRQHSNLRPKHKHTKSYVQTYWPYLPLLIIVGFGIMLVRPWAQGTKHRSGVLSYATTMNSDSLLQATNNARESNKQSDLRLNSDLAKAAQNKANDMVSRNYWSHNTPDGTQPWTFITNTGYEYQKSAENLAYGFSTGSDVISGWMNSPEHRENILDKAFLDVGFGYANSPNFVGKGPVTVVVAYYGRPQSAAPYIATTQGAQSFTPAPSTTANNVSKTPQTISRVSSLTGTWLPGATLIFIFLLGAAVAGLVIKHGWAIRRTITKSERYVIKHPLVDITLLALVVVAIIAIGKVGVIL